MTGTSEPHPVTGQPVGAPVDATPAQRPSPVTLAGRYGRIERLAQHHDATNDVVVVVSAIRGMTDDIFSITDNIKEGQNVSVTLDGPLRKGNDGNVRPARPVLDTPIEYPEHARRAGIDLDLLDTNLALPVRERWRQHDAALALILKLEKAKHEHDARLLVHEADRPPDLSGI